MNEDRLKGKKEISDYARMSWQVIKREMDKGFPARKVGGVWYSSRELIDKFNQDQIMGEKGWPHK
jgi:hypothetical protein